MILLGADTAVCSRCTGTCNCMQSTRYIVITYTSSHTTTLIASAREFAKAARDYRPSVFGANARAALIERSPSSPAKAAALPKMLAWLARATRKT